MKLASDSLKGRVFEISLGDLNEDEGQAHRKMYLKALHVQGRSVLTNFYGMSLTTDKLRSLIRKWCTKIETRTEIKTTDGYTLRVFVICFTTRRQVHVKKTCYAQTAQVIRIKRKMHEIVKTSLSTCDLRACVQKFQHELIGKDIEQTCSKIHPLRDVFVRKVKVVRQPKLDTEHVLQAHGHDVPASQEDVGAPVAAEATW